MNKFELARVLSNKTELQLYQCKNIINILIETIEIRIVEGDKIILAGFGTFVRRKRNARQGRNPRTGENVPIEESYYPAFSPGKDFKGKVKTGLSKEINSECISSNDREAGTGIHPVSRSDRSNDVPLSKITKAPNRKNQSNKIVAP